MFVKVDIKEEPSDCDAHSLELKPKTKEENCCGATADTNFENEQLISKITGFGKKDANLGIKEEPEDCDIHSLELNPKTKEHSCCGAVPDTLFENEQLINKITGFKKKDVTLGIKEKPQDCDIHLLELNPKTKEHSCGAVPDILFENESMRFINKVTEFEKIDVKLGIKEEPPDCDVNPLELNPKSTGGNCCGAVPDTIFENESMRFVNKITEFEKIDVKLGIKEEPPDYDANSLELNPKSTEGNCCGAVPDTLFENEAQRVITEYSDREKMDIKVELKEEVLDSDVCSPVVKLEPIEENVYFATHNTLLEYKAQRAITECSDHDKMDIKIELKEEMLDSDDVCSPVVKLEPTEENVYFTTHNTLLECKEEKEIDKAVMKEKIKVEVSSFSHGNAGPHMENLSNYMGNSSTSFNDVKLENKNSKAHKCKICGNSFTRATHLREHIYIHEGKTPHLCEICGKSFTQTSSLRGHLLIHKGINPHKCKYCEKSFSRKSHLREHILIHEGKKPHMCEVCKKSFTQASSLRGHLLIHQCKTLHKCKYCEKCFTHESSLKRHLLIHEGINPHKCDVCGKSFTRTSHLREHVYIHEGKKPNKCEVCGKSFTQASSLRVHLLTHEGKQPCCAICGKRFTYVSHLKEHILTHQSKKSYKCEVCEKSFTHRSSLRKHIFIHESRKPPKV